MITLFPDNTLCIQIEFPCIENYSKASTFQYFLIFSKLHNNPFMYNVIFRLSMSGHQSHNSLKYSICLLLIMTHYMILMLIIHQVIESFAYMIMHCKNTGVKTDDLIKAFQREKCWRIGHRKEMAWDERVCFAQSGRLLVLHNWPTFCCSWDCYNWENRHPLS